MFNRNMVRVLRVLTDIAVLAFAPHRVVVATRETTFLPKSETL